MIIQWKTTYKAVTNNEVCTKRYNSELHPSTSKFLAGPNLEGIRVWGQTGGRKVGESIKVGWDEKDSKL